MKLGQRQWTRDELLLAVNLYCKLPFGRMNSRNSDITALAVLLQRTPGSVALKLCNFASLDASLPRTGMTNVSQLDRQIWGEFCADWNDMAFESERLLAQARHITLEEVAGTAEADDTEPTPAGRVKEQLIKARVNQQFFRQAVLAAYDNTCCVTGLRQPDLLVAGHIKPWSVDAANRLNPRNGLALNSLHDRAFELGLFTVRPEDYVIEVSSALRAVQAENPSMISLLLGCDAKPLRLPARKRFLPDPAFLDWHRTTRFQRR